MSTQRAVQVEAGLGVRAVDDLRGTQASTSRVVSTQVDMWTSRNAALRTIAFIALLPACRGWAPDGPRREIETSRAIVAKAPERYESHVAAGYVAWAASRLSDTAGGRRAMLDILATGSPPARDVVARTFMTGLVPRPLVDDRAPDHELISALATAYERAPSDVVRRALVASRDPRAMADALRSTDTGESHDAFVALGELATPDAAAALANAPARLQAWRGDFACPRRSPEARRDRQGAGAQGIDLAPVGMTALEQVDAAGPCEALVDDLVVHFRDKSCFVGRHRGEWGGWLEVDDARTRTSSYLGGALPLRFVDRADDVLVLSGLCHMLLCVGDVGVIHRGRDGRWVQRAAIRLPGAPTSYAMDSAGRLVLGIATGGAAQCATASRPGERITVLVEEDGALTLLE